jgi:hypothetical protein
LQQHLEQSIGRVFAAVAKIVACSPIFSDAIVQRDKIAFPSFGDAFICAIASDAAGAAGHNASFICFDELWGIQSERGRRFWDEMSTSPVRKISARLTTTYAGYSGESELLEELYKRGLAQPQIGKDLYAGAGLLMFWSHQPVAPWQSQAWLDEQRRSLRPNQYLRQIENRFVTSESAFLPPGSWDACIDDKLTPVISDPELTRLGRYRRQRQARQHRHRRRDLESRNAESPPCLASDIPTVTNRPVRFRGNNRADRA